MEKTISGTLGKYIFQSLPVCGSGPLVMAVTQSETQLSCTLCCGGQLGRQPRQLLTGQAQDSKQSSRHQVNKNMFKKEIAARSTVA